MIRRSFGQRKPRLGSLGFTALMLLSLLLAACGSATATKHSGPPQPLIIVPNEGGALVQNFNPFVAITGGVNSEGQFGPIFETLLFFNRADGTIHPWLADSYSFSTDATQITFKLHQGIKWSDGQPFTADDVAFTFNVMQQYPAADYQGLDSSIKSVTAVDPQTVTITLTAPNSSILWPIGGQTWIVAKHIWSGVGDPTKYTDANPVGTGPYVFKSFTPQLITLTKNSTFWGSPKPVVPELEFPAYNDNVTNEADMDRGKTDWNGVFPQHIKDFTTHSYNHYYFAPSDPLMLFLNLSRSPLDQLPVRQAINLAIDRNKINTLGELGFEPPAHPTGLILPANQQFLDPTYANASFSVDTAQAVQILNAAGYHKGSDGVMVGPGGKKLSFTATGVTGYSDWDSDYQIIAQDLKQVGIQLTPKDYDSSAVAQDIQSGNFDMAIYYETPGPTPYYIYDQVLASGNIGTSNYERWNDPASDALLTQYNTSTDLNTQKQAMYGIEKIMVEKLPVIFLQNEPYWYEYNTLKYVGWPDQGNMYAEASPFSYPDDEMVLLHLHQ